MEDEAKRAKEAEKVKGEEEEEEEDSSVLFTFHALPRSSSNAALACSWLVCWFWYFSRCVPFVFRQPPAARHHGWYG